MQLSQHATARQFYDVCYVCTCSVLLGDIKVDHCVDLDYDDPRTGARIVAGGKPAPGLYEKALKLHERYKAMRASSTRIVIDRSSAFPLHYAGEYPRLKY